MPHTKKEPARISVSEFRDILANGDSNDSEIDALGQALERAGDIVFSAGQVVRLEEDLAQILIENGYDPDGEEDE
jgi:hypothetical protein